MSIRHRVLATAGVTALVAAPVTLASGAAHAMPASDPTVTDLGNGISEIVYTAPGNHTFTAPAGITKVSAILVGGGAGGSILGDSTTFLAYAGGGGGVVYVDSVDVTSPVTFTVGEGGAATTAGSGGDTTLGVDLAGGGGVLVGQSGSPQNLDGAVAHIEPPSSFGVPVGVPGARVTVIVLVGAASRPLMRRKIPRCSPRSWVSRNTARAEAARS